MIKHLLFAAAFASFSLAAAAPAWADGFDDCVAKVQAQLGIAHSPSSFVDAVTHGKLYAHEGLYLSMSDVAYTAIDSYDNQQIAINLAEKTRRELDDFNRLLGEIQQTMPEQAQQIEIIQKHLAARYEREKQDADQARKETGYALRTLCREGSDYYGAPASEPPPAEPASPAESVPPAPTAESTGPEMTIMLGDAHQSRNLKTGALSPGNHAPGATAHLQSGSSYQGSVSIGANLPAGYTIYIFFHSQVWAVLSPTGGGFTVGENKGFGAANDVNAVACLTGASVGGLLPNDRDGQKGCLYNADIDILWQP